MNPSDYAESLTIQLRKGCLVYCVLLSCSKQEQYAGDIVRRLSDSELMVVEGTIYPLLNRLQKYGYLLHEWRESEQGPPRKYYSLTDSGFQLVDELKHRIKMLNSSLKDLEKGVN